MERKIEIGDTIEFIDEVVEIDFLTIIKNIDQRSSLVKISDLKQISKDLEQYINHPLTIKKVKITYAEGGMEDSFIDEDVRVSILENGGEILNLEGINESNQKPIALSNIQTDEIKIIPQDKLKKEEEIKKPIIDKEIIPGIKLSLSSSKTLIISVETVSSKEILMEALSEKGLEEVVTMNQRGDYEGKINNVENIYNLIEIIRDKKIFGTNKKIEKEYSIQDHTEVVAEQMFKESDQTTPFEMDIQVSDDISLTLTKDNFLLIKSATPESDKIIEESSKELNNEILFKKNQRGDYEYNFKEEINDDNYIEYGVWKAKMLISKVKEKLILQKYKKKPNTNNQKL